MTAELVILEKCQQNWGHSISVQDFRSVIYHGLESCLEVMFIHEDNAGKGNFWMIVTWISLAELLNAILKAVN